MKGLKKFLKLIPKIYKEYAFTKTTDGSPLFLHKDTKNGKIMAIIAVGNDKKFIKETIEILKRLI